MRERTALGDAFDDLVADVHADDVLRRRIAERSEAQERSSRRRPVVLLAAAAVAVLGLVAATLAVVRASTDDEAVMTVPSPAHAGWRDVAPMPLSDRRGAATAWTGSEVLVWGGGTASGQTAFEDGAVYDPVRDRWRPMAGAPIAGRADPVAAWTGKELLVWSGHGEVRTPAGGAAYDPATDRWRRLPDAPIPDRAWSEGAWTGEELVVWGGYNPTFEARPGEGNASGDGAAYDPETNRWRVLPEAPIEARFYHGMTWTGSEVVVWGGATGDGVGGREFADGAAYDPARNSWRVLPPAPVGARSGHIQVWSGSKVLVWGGRTGTAWNYDAMTLDPVSGDWRRSGSAAQNAPATAVWTGSRLFAWPQASALDPATGAWERQPDGPLASSQDVTMVAVGDDVIVWTPDGGAAYRLPTAMQAAPALQPCGHAFDDLTPTYVPSGWDPSPHPGTGGGGSAGIAYWEGASGQHVTVMRSSSSQPLSKDGKQVINVLDHDATIGAIHEGFGVQTSCGFDLTGFGISREDLRLFAEGLVDGTQGFALWPETDFGHVVESARRLAAGEDPWRADPAATAERFAAEVLGWKGAEADGSLDDRGIMHVRAGDRAAQVGVQRNVANRWWTVVYVNTFGDDDLSASVVITPDEATIGVSSPRRYESIDMRLGRGDHVDHIGQDWSEGGARVPFGPPGDLSAPGFVLTLFNAGTGSPDYADAWGTTLPAGPMSAG